MAPPELPELKQAPSRPPSPSIALARRPRGIVLAGALVDVHLRLRRRASRGGGGGAVTVAELVDDL